MPYRSIEKTDSDKMKDIEQKNPENHQVQSIQSTLFNEDTIKFPQQKRKKDGAS